MQFAHPHLIKYLTMAEDTELMYEVDIERLHELEAAVKLRHLDRMIELYTEMEKKKTHLVSES